jgi:hypothetical protein
MDPLPHGTDLLIDATMARALHADACRTHAIVAWVLLVGSAGVSGAIRRPAGDVRSGGMALPAAGGYAGRYPGAVAAWAGTVRADAG